MNNQDTNNQSITLEDLSAQHVADIKGGPNPKVKRTVVLQSSATAGQEDGNLLVSLASNHNETVVANEAEEAAAETARLTDLAIGEEQSSEIKGGMLLPAVQKVR